MKICTLTYTYTANKRQPNWSVRKQKQNTLNSIYSSPRTHWTNVNVIRVWVLNRCKYLHTVHILDWYTVCNHHPSRVHILCCKWISIPVAYCSDKFVYSLQSHAMLSDLTVFSYCSFDECFLFPQPSTSDLQQSVCIASSLMFHFSCSFPSIVPISLNNNLFAACDKRE